jgi:hypothetical protein
MAEICSTDRKGFTGFLILFLIGILSSGCNIEPSPAKTVSLENPSPTVSSLAVTQKTVLRVSPTTLPPYPAQSSPVDDNLLPPYPPAAVTSTPVPLILVTPATTFTPTLTNTPTVLPTVWEQRFSPICTTGLQKQSCFDDLLQIEFEYPLEWGKITASLQEGGQAGYKYNYQFNKTISIHAGGRSKDFSEGRERFFTDFSGFFGLSKAQRCGEYYDNLSCVNLNSEVYIYYLFSKAAHLCDPGPGVFSQPKILIAVNLPFNETINGFVFVGNLLAGEAGKLYQKDLEELIGPWKSPDYHGCDENGISSFDLEMEEFVQRIKERKIGSATLQVVDDWYQLARSIKPGE